MADDIRTRLSEALDEAPEKRQGHFGGCSAYMFAVGATCSCGHAEWLARLIERDRKLLTDHAAAELGVRGAMYLTHVDGLQPYPLAVQKRDALKAELDRAAALWLGTPEGS